MVSQALSECSKKEEKSMDSPEVEDPQCSSQDEDKAKEVLRLPRDTGTGTGDESSYSSFSSFLKTDDSMRSSEEAEAGFCVKNGMIWEKVDDKSEIKSRPIRKAPPWLDHINLTPELMYRYQVNSREMTNVLEADLEVLKKFDQPKLVDDQLQQLYVDLELEGLSTKLKLEEGLTTSSCSSGEELQTTSIQRQQNKKKKRQHDYTELVMIYEENMPLPSPSRTAVVSS